MHWRVTVRYPIGTHSSHREAQAACAVQLILERKSVGNMPARPAIEKRG
jgi:hypothetical protein